jgi:hypothetical protein
MRLKEKRATGDNNKQRTTMIDCGERSASD